MNKQMQKGLACTALALATLFVSTSPLCAQSATAVSQFNLPEFTGTWYEVAHLPNKWEKRCTNQPTVLYALGDNPGTVQVGTFCQLKNSSTDYQNKTGKQEKGNAGKLKLSHLVLLHTKLWVLALDPKYQWALVGTPNHKMLSLLSKTPELAPDTLQQMKTTARAQGYNVDKLIMPPLHPEAFPTISTH